MIERPACPARHWLFGAATSLLMLGPQFAHAQSAAADSDGQPDARQSSESLNRPNPLFGAVKRELGFLKENEQPAPAPRHTAGEPGLLPFLGLPGSGASQKDNTASQPAAAQGRRLQRTTRAAQPRAIRQTAGETPAAKPAEKPGFLDILLGRDKPQNPPQRVNRRPIEPPTTEARPTALPRLLPGFLQPKAEQRPTVTYRPRQARPTTQPQAQRTVSQPPTLELKKAAAPSPALDDFENPFTEITEAEADSKNDTPFTGLKLDEPLETATPVVRSASNTDENTVTVRKRARTADAVEPKLAQAPAPLPLEPEAAHVNKQPEPQVDNPRDKRMKLLALRNTQSGLKGFCPVTLRDRRDLLDADDSITSTFNGKTYHLASLEAKAKFDASPAKYAPANGGHDVIVLTEGHVELEGSLENAVWFQDRLYLFSSAATLETFIQNPEKYSGKPAQKADVETETPAVELEPEAGSEE